MHLDRVEALSLASEIIETAQREGLSAAQIILAVPHIHLHACGRLLESVGKFPLFLGAQNCHHEAKGAFTGEIAAAMLASYQVAYVIIGHSERRQYAFEDSKQLIAKLKRCFENNLKAIFCCGEPLAVRNAQGHLAYVRLQIEEVLSTLQPAELMNIALAYEPIWAIGTGLTANTAQIAEMHDSLRQLLMELSPAHGQQMPILYGGSCKASNAADIFATPNVDGALVGGAALDTREFLNIVKAIQDK